MAAQDQEEYGISLPPEEYGISSEPNQNIGPESENATTYMRPEDVAFQGAEERKIFGVLPDPFPGTTRRAEEKREFIDKLIQATGVSRSEARSLYDQQRKERSKELASWQQGINNKQKLEKAQDFLQKSQETDDPALKKAYELQASKLFQSVEGRPVYGEERPNADREVPNTSRPNVDPQTANTLSGLDRLMREYGGAEAQYRASIGRLSGYEKMYEQGANELAKAYNTVGEAKAEILEKAQGQLFENAAEMDRVRFEYENAAKLAADDIEAAYKDIQNYRIDPERLMKAKGNKIVGGLAMALGAVGASMSGQPNMVANYIDKMIDRDIAAQQAELQKKKFGVEGRMNMLGILRERFKSEESAIAMARSALKDAYATNLEEVAAKHEGTIHAANAKKDAALQRMQSEQQKQNAIQGIERSRREKILLGMQMRQAQIESAQSNLKMSPTFDVMPGYKMTPEQEKKARELEDIYIPLIADMEELRDLRAAYKGEAFGTEAAERMMTLSSNIMTAMGQASGMGALQGADIALLGKRVPEDPTSFNLFERLISAGNVDSTLNKLNASLSQLKRARRNRLGVQNAIPLSAPSYKVEGKASTKTKQGG